MWNSAGARSCGSWFKTRTPAARLAVGRVLVSKGGFAAKGAIG
jgi:hypothetical protein